MFSRKTVETFDEILSSFHEMWCWLNPYLCLPPNTVYQIQINPGFCGKILLVLVKREVIAFPRSSRRAVGRDLWRPFVSGEARFSGGIHHGGGFVSGVNWWAPEKRDKYFCGKYCSKYCTISPTTLRTHMGMGHVLWVVFKWVDEHPEQPSSFSRARRYDDGDLEHLTETRLQKGSWGDLTAI